MQLQLFGSEQLSPKQIWQIPTELPDLSQETEVSIDTETYDPGLKNNEGPAYFKCDRNNTSTGFICGISLAWRDQKIYIPIRHAYKNYFDRNLVQRWLKSLSLQSHTKFVFHNFQYDWGWIQAIFDLPPPAQVDDTMAMASIVNENLFSFDLDNLCHWQDLPGKEVMSDKNRLHELSPESVGSYAEQDAVSTLLLAQKLRPLLTAENLDAAYQIERELMPMT